MHTQSFHMNTNNDATTSSILTDIKDDNNRQKKAIQQLNNSGLYQTKQTWLMVFDYPVRCDRDVVMSSHQHQMRRLCFLTNGSAPNITLMDHSHHLFILFTGRRKEMMGGGVRREMGRCGGWKSEVLFGVCCMHNWLISTRAPAEHSAMNG